MASYNKYNNVVSKQSGRHMKKQWTSKTNLAPSPNEEEPNIPERGTKRKSEVAVAGSDLGSKRFALGNLTNAEGTTSANSKPQGFLDTLLTCKVANLLKKPLIRAKPQNLARGDPTKPDSKDESTMSTNTTMKMHQGPRIMTRLAKRNLKLKELEEKQTTSLTNVAAHSNGDTTDRRPLKAIPSGENKENVLKQEPDSTQPLSDSKLKPGRVSSESRTDDFSTIDISEDSSMYVTATDILDDGQPNTSGQTTCPNKDPSNGPGMPLENVLTWTRQTDDNADKPVRAEDIAVPKKGEISLAVLRAKLATEHLCKPRKVLPPGVEDYDKSNHGDVLEMSEYAQDIFDYLDSCQDQCAVPDYMVRQHEITKWMRALLIDWMIEIQETLALNHETLYLTVKIIDIYLSRKVVERNKLQLIGIASMLISAKYDERSPPTVEDFIYLSDGAYVRKDILDMERQVFKTIGFMVGLPLSYTFLRRYARVCHIPMKTLTLARYILETNLMEYKLVTVRETILASAALFIARRMVGMKGWNETLEHYTGCEVHHFANVVELMNENIVQRKSLLSSVHKKYSHELFFKVSHLPVIINMAQMFSNEPLTNRVPIKVLRITKSTGIALLNHSDAVATKPASISTGNTASKPDKKSNTIEEPTTTTSTEGGAAVIENPSSTEVDEASAKKDTTE